MTEEEAKKKVCPYKILAWAMNKCDANCEGAGCMMWREYQPSNSLGERDGYCGLGDRP
jgi:hypothetical protein